MSAAGRFVVGALVAAAAFAGSRPGVVAAAAPKPDSVDLYGQRCLFAVVRSEYERPMARPLFALYEDGSVLWASAPERPSWDSIQYLRAHLTTSDRDRLWRLAQEAAWVVKVRPPGAPDEYWPAYLAEPYDSLGGLLQVYLAPDGPSRVVAVLGWGWANRPTDRNAGMLSRILHRGSAMPPEVAQLLASAGALTRSAAGTPWRPTYLGLYGWPAAYGDTARALAEWPPWLPRPAAPRLESRGRYFAELRPDLKPALYALLAQAGSGTISWRGSRWYLRAGDAVLPGEHLWAAAQEAARDQARLPDRKNLLLLYALTTLALVFVCGAAFVQFRARHGLAAALPEPGDAAMDSAARAMRQAWYASALLVSAGVILVIMIFLLFITPALF